MVRWLLACLLLGTGTARADDSEFVAPPTHRVVMENLTAVRYNPLGLQEYFTVSYRLRLMESDSILFNDTYFQIGPTVALSPAFMKAGVALRVVPIAVLELAAAYRYQYFFGIFDHVVAFDDPGDDWSDSSLDVLGEDALAMGGHQIMLQARVQAAVGPVAVRNTGRFEYNAMPLRSGAVGYYDSTPDMLVPDDGWLFVNDTNLMYMWGDSHALKTGVAYTATIPMFGGGTGADGNASHRIGPIVTYTFFDRPGAAFNKPMLILLTQWHVQHRFRAGQDVSAAIPYAALAFSFEGDLIPWN